MAEEDRRNSAAHGGQFFAEVPVVRQRTRDWDVDSRRLVVALVVAVVVTLGAFVAAIGRYFARMQEAVELEQVSIGPFDLLVSG